MILGDSTLFINFLKLGDKQSGILVGDSTLFINFLLGDKHFWAINKVELPKRSHYLELPKRSLLGNSTLFIAQKKAILSFGQFHIV